MAYLGARFVLSFTERGLFETGGPSRERLWRAEASGVPLLLDDFGTGSTSIKYLAEFPISILKIDKSYLDSTTDPDPARAERAKMLMLAMTQLALAPRPPRGGRRRRRAGTPPDRHRDGLSPGSRLALPTRRAPSGRRQGPAGRRRLDGLSANGRARTRLATLRSSPGFAGSGPVRLPLCARERPSSAGAPNDRSPGVPRRRRAPRAACSPD